MVATTTHSPRRYPGFAATLTHARRGSRNWWRARAGTLLVDLVDRRLQHDRGSAASARRSVAARRAAEQVSPTTLRRAIHAVIAKVIEGARPIDVLDALGEYAKQLNCGGHFGLGGEVYRFMIERARPAGARHRLSQWYEDLGYSLREAGRRDAASIAYHRGLELADESHDVFARFRLQIAQAHVDRIEHRFDEARALLSSALESAEAFGRLDLVVRAGHEAGVLAHDSGHVQDALAFYTRALHASGYGDGEHRHGRERLILDIARALADVGYRTEARNAFATLATIAQERFTRWIATLNLLDLATEEPDPWLFDEYRLALASTPMSAPLRLFYYARVAEGSVIFGRDAEAKMHQASAHRLAKRAGLPTPEPRSPDPRRRTIVVDETVVANLLSTVHEFTSAPRRRVDARYRPLHIESRRGSRRLFLRRGRSPGSDRP